MGKAEFMTPKAIANRMKAKGLQKLRWFCQLCNKQCRDENGFKCHADSEGHKRQLSLFASGPGKFLSNYSYEFEKTFLDELKRRFGSKRVHANLVYNEYIRDKNHTHMNATRWTTLSGFVRYLGKTGKCIVDETPKGWYMSYINRDPEVIARQEKLAKKEKMDVTDEERTRLQIEKRLFELAKIGTDPDGEENGEEGAEDAESFDPEKPHETIMFSFFRAGANKDFNVKSEVKSEIKSDPDSSTQTPSEDTPSDENGMAIKPEPTDESDEAVRDTNSPPSTASTPSSNTSTSTTSTTTSTSTLSSTPSSSSSISTKPLKSVNPFDLAAKSAKDSKEKEGSKDLKRKKSAMEELRDAEERDREKRNRRDYWVTTGIVVKIMHKSLADGKYYKAKGVVEDVIDRYTAQIKVLDFGDVLKLDQSHLETVIPQIGGKVKVVNGAWRGETAVLQGLDVDNFAAKIKLSSGASSGKIITSVPYEDICKCA